MNRPDGLNNPMSINGGIGLGHADMEQRCEDSPAVLGYDWDGSALIIRWVDGTEDRYTDMQAAAIAIREMEEN